MAPTDRPLYTPDASFDGGSLDCGNGLLLTAHSTGRVIQALDG